MDDRHIRQQEKINLMLTREIKDLRGYVENVLKPREAGVFQGGLYDDLRVPVTSTKLGTVRQPGFSLFKNNGAASTGVYAYWFDKNAEEELFFTAQMPHTWVGNDPIYPHVHWSPKDATAGNVVWGLEYTWAAKEGTFGNTTIITVTDAADGTAYKHQLAFFASISGTGFDYSSMLVCRMFRQAAAGADTYNNDAGLLEFDFHFRKTRSGTSSPTY